MTILSTSRYKHLQHYYSDSLDDLPSISDMGDIFHLFTPDNKMIDYLFNGTTWELDKTIINTQNTGISTDGGTVNNSYEKDPQGLGVQRVVIAAFPNLTLTHSTIQVDTTSTSILPANPNRKYLLIVNISDTDMYLSFDTDAVVSQGIPISSNNGNLELQPWFVSTQAIKAINNVGLKNLLVTEGV